MSENADQTDHYKKLGFMCGLEVHQRLATKSKLFCSCATDLNLDARETGAIERMQRAVAGEMGAIDYSSEFEEKRERRFTYRTYDSKSCLVDIDEEPPHEMNHEALVVAIAIAKSMGMNVVDEFQIMRKGVVDGSDPSAFQRTVMVALNGHIDVDGQRINVPTMFLEEESSGIISSTSYDVTYGTDRLGIPLVEIDTDPHIPSPKAAKAVALYIGTLLRITGMVQRGIGSIRQDVNMSIKGGARVEIKGLQELELMDKFIDNEIARQQALLSIRDELEANKAKIGRTLEVTSIFKGTKSKILEGKASVYALSLFGFSGIIGREINPMRRLGTEISNYAKMAGVKGIIHSDEDMKKYQITGSEIGALRKSLGIREEDSFILVAADSHDIAKRAIELARWRAEHAMSGVPKETRMASDITNCTTTFLRPLPGGARMYPETDVRPIYMTKEELSKANEIIPDIEKERRYLKSLVKSDDMAERLMVSQRLRLFKLLEKSTNANKDFIVNILMQKFTELRRGGVAVESIADDEWVHIFDCYAKNIVTKQAIEELIKIAASGIKGKEIDAEIDARKLHKISGRALKDLVTQESKNGPEGSVMKVIMQKYRNVVDGDELAKLLKK